MTFRLRCVLLLFAVACYFVQMLIPLLSVDGNTYFESPLFAISMMSTNISSYKYNYMMIGLSPFVLASVVAEFLRWQFPNVVLKYRRASALDLYQVFVYLLSFFLSVHVLMYMSPSMWSYSVFIILAELMISVMMVEQLINFVKYLDIVSRPVFVLLGLNVAVSSIVMALSSSDIYKTLLSVTVTLSMIVYVFADVKACYGKKMKAVVHV